MKTSFVGSRKTILSRIVHWGTMTACAAGLSVSFLDAADIDVTTLSDAGAGSYRQSLSVANSGDNLVFDSLTSGSTLTNGSSLIFTKSVSLVNNSGTPITLTDPHAYQIGSPLTLNWAGTLNLNGNLSNNGASTGSLIMNSPGTVALSGNNSYSGGTMFEGGTLQLLSNTALGTGNLTVNGLTATVLSLSNGVQINNNVQLDSASTLIVNVSSSNTATLGGIISESGGAGSLVLNGNGTLVLSGANTFSGGIYVAGNSTIDVNNSSALGSGLLTNAGGLNLNLANGVTVNNDIKLENNIVTNVNSGTATLGGIISETASSSLTKTGLGTLILGGSDTYTGNTTVQQGTLSVTGTIQGNTIIDSGATLMGSGTVGNVTNNGTVQPGNSGIGNLTVNGNFTQNSGGTTNILVNSSGNTPGVNNGHLSISGQANLDGTLNIQSVGGGNFNTGTQYTILNATSGRIGTFSSVTSNLSLYTVNVTYDPNDVMIKLVQTGSLVNSAVTNNQVAVSNALQGISLTSTGSVFTMINTLGSESAGAQRQAYNQMSGEQYGDTQTLALEVGDMFQQRVVNRIFTSSIFLGSSPSISVFSNSQSDETVRGQSPTSTIGGWFQGYGMTGNIQSDNNGAGLSYSQGGGVYGVDLAADESGMIGVVMGNSYVGYHDGFSGGGQMTSYQVGLYALKQNDTGYVLGTTNYGYDNFSSNRNVMIGGANQTLRGNYLGHQFGANIETGLKVDANWFQLQPLIGLQYLYLAQQGFDESGGPAALSVSAQQASALRSNLGVRFISPQFTGRYGAVWTPYGETRWAADLLGNDRIVNATIGGAPAGGTFTTSGTKLGTNYGIFTKGVQVQFNDYWSAFATIDVFVGTNIHTETGAAGIVYVW